MGGEGFAVLSYHLIGVAMVGGNQQNTVHLLDGGGYLADAGVHCLHGGYRGAEHAGMADHVAVGEVQNNHVIFSGMDAL